MDVLRRDLQLKAREPGPAGSPGGAVELGARDDGAPRPTAEDPPA